MDDDIRSSFKERYEYKEGTSYHSFQLNDVLIIQNIFAFVSRPRVRGVWKIRESGSGTGTGTATGVNWETRKSISVVKSFSIYNTR